jgi:hypothetical protein
MHTGRGLMYTVIGLRRSGGVHRHDEGDSS